MVEILAVVIVLGILAGVAVPQYLNHRTRARVAAVSSDARNLGAMIEDAWAKDRRYPDALDAAASQVPGAALSQNNRVAQYAATGGGFTLCLVYVEGATSKAYARYDSREGGLVGKGTGDGGTLCEPTAPTPPVTPPTDGGGGGGGGGGDGGGGGGSTGDETDGSAPQNVVVDAVPGEPRATVTWDPVDGATEYAVFLDGATTPAWTGTDPTTVLTGLDKGVHEVTVQATKSGGSKTAKSEAVPFTIYGDNDFLTNAHPVPTGGPQTWDSRNYDNTTATAETGEPGTSRKGRWWTLTVPRDASYTFTHIAPSGGGTALTNTTVAVWRTTTADVTTLGAEIASAYDQVTIDGRAGQTYKIRISALSDNGGYVGQFRLRVLHGPDNDSLIHADPITGLASGGTWHSTDVDNTWAGMETGEAAGNRRSTWWTLTPTRDSAYTFGVAAPSGGGTAITDPTIRVWRSTATDVTALGTELHREYNQVVLDAKAGETYKISVSDSSGSSAAYRGVFRLRVIMAPANDTLGNAAAVGTLSPGVAWHSEDVDNTYAGTETGEPSGNRRSLWWTLTAPRDASYTFRVAAPSGGGAAVTDPTIGVWNSTATSVTALGTVISQTYNSVTIDGRAGQIYKIRLSDSSGSVATYRGVQRLQVTAGPANDHLSQAVAIPDVGAGGTWHSDDVDNTFAGNETGEPAGGRSVWWTFTPSRSATYIFRGVASTGGNLLTNPRITAWNTTSTSVTGLGTQIAANYDQISFAATAGQTYKIRVNAASSSAGYFGLFRLRVTS